jgi:uncharacterized membrane protein
MTRLLPTVMIALSVGAAVVYAIDGTNWRMVAYWGAAAVLNYSVTW